MKYIKILFLVMLCSTTLESSNNILPKSPYSKQRSKIIDTSENLKQELDESKNDECLPSNPTQYLKPMTKSKSQEELAAFLLSRHQTPANLNLSGHPDSLRTNPSEDLDDQRFHSARGSNPSRASDCSFYSCDSSKTSGSK